MTEDQLEQEALGWLAEAGYATLLGPDIAPDGDAPERGDYRQVLLPFRLREATNPDALWLHHCCQGDERIVPTAPQLWHAFSYYFHTSSKKALSVSAKCLI